MFKKWVVFFLLLGAQQTYAQEPSVKEAMRGHVYVLASDFMEGRLTGSKGEELAFEYIIDAFERMGVPAVSSDGFLQPFDFELGKELVGEPRLRLNAKELSLEESYWVMPYASSGSASSVPYTIHTKEDLEREVLIEEPTIFEVNNAVFLDGPAHPHAKIDYAAAIKTLKDKGASAVLFYTTESMLPPPPSDLSRRVKGMGIPVLFLKEEPNRKAKRHYDLDIALQPIEITGHNIVASLDNNADETVVFGAHYDHLGHGQYGGSLYRGKEALIHNGADDNASGIAMLLELARWLKTDGPKNQNYLFIAFSGEELGLFGSSYFTKNPLIPLDKVKYMFNFDMVGSLDTATNDLALNGVGTSPRFTDIINRLDAGKLSIKTSESGVGPSDHTQFYLKDIPVIHFFTGTTPHYHRPTDDPHRLNYDGLHTIFEYAKQFVNALAKEDDLPFSKTKDADARKAPAFSVTLGVVPDYMFSGSGMRIDGVTEGKPADKAGIKAGDVVVKMGDVNVTDMMSYMNGLAQFKPGDKAKVVVLRNNVEKTLNVIF